MRFVRTLFEAGVGLDELTRLCHALDGGGGDAIEFLLCLRARLAARRAALDVLDGHLEQMISAIGADTAKASARACQPRSEERRVGKEWGRTCQSRWSPYH